MDARMNTTAQNWTLLYRSLAERWRPEDVIAYLLEQPETATWGPTVLATLRGAIARAYFPKTSGMSTRFERARGPASTLKVAAALFPEPTPPCADPHDPQAIEAALLAINAALGRRGGSDFKARPPAHERPKAWRHHGAFNKRWRLAITLERKLATYRKHARLTALAHVAKSRLAHAIPWPAFAADARSAAFIAYYTAALNRRSLFTAGHQPSAYDAVAEVLFDALDPVTAAWLAIAYVHPSPEVIAQLREQSRGELLGRWFAIMHDGADVLRELVTTAAYDTERCVVKRGDDSSTWNAAAGGYNRAREGWLACLASLGMDETLDAFCPPKAMRLMAADVVAMHHHYGSGDVDPNTRVWAKLPKPWAVLILGTPCTRAMVEAACADVGVPAKSWVAARVPRAVPFTPTPELVHGVSVASPELVDILRRAGWYAGPSKVKQEVHNE